MFHLEKELPENKKAVFVGRLSLDLGFTLISNNIKSTGKFKKECKEFYCQGILPAYPRSFLLRTQPVVGLRSC